MKKSNKKEFASMSELLGIQNGIPVFSWKAGDVWILFV